MEELKKELIAEYKLLLSQNIFNIGRPPEESSNILLSAFIQALNIVTTPKDD